MTYGMMQNLPILRYIADQQGLGVTRAHDVTVRYLELSHCKSS